MRRAMLAIAVFLLHPAAVQAANPNDIFMVRTTTKAPEAVVAAMKSYSAEKKWQFLPGVRLLPYECNEPTWEAHLDGLRQQQHGGHAGQ